MKKIILKNDFHNTEVTLIPKNGYLSLAQIKRAQSVLCGIDECICSDDLGCRGPQNIFCELDYSSGVLQGAWVWVKIKDERRTK